MNHPVKTHEEELLAGERFSFGENWKKLLSSLNEERILEAEKSLKNFLEVSDLKNKTFLDIGSGSGLFSLAARRLGATVFSFDYDPKSVSCTRELKKRFFMDDPLWKIEEGSVLDSSYLKSLGKFDIVYSWGVLHHTGKQWDALKNIDENLSKGGKLFIALYNDQGRTSKIWWFVKKAYVSLPDALKFLILIPAFFRLWAPTILKDTLKLNPFSSWNLYKNQRGMSPYRDVVDWVGGFPFEVSTPEEVFNFYKTRGYTLTQLKTCAGGLGCNEFVFQKD